MKSLNQRIRRFRKDVSGVAALWSTLLAVIIFALTALAVDGSYIYYTRAELQSTADSAALAAVSDIENHITVGNAYAEINMPAADHGDVLADVDIEDGTWDSDTRTFDASGTPANSVRVTTRTAAANGNALGLFFAPIIGSDTIDVAMSAVATTLGSDDPPLACILTLSNLDLSIQVTGTPKVTADDCSIMSNSTGDPSISQTGRSEVTAECMHAAGSIVETNNITMSLDCESYLENQPPVPDPYSDLSVSKPLPACRTDIPDFNDSEVDVVLSPTDAAGNPVTFCSNVTLHNNVTFNPGTYYFSGSLTINSGANVYGDGVTLILSSNEDSSSNNININGFATVDLTAPTSGDYAGVLLYQDGAVDWTTGSTINGTSASTMTGALYFPNTDLTLNGDSDTSGDSLGCLQVVAETVKFAGTGNFNVANNCDGTGVRDIPLAGDLRFALVD